MNRKDTIRSNQVSTMETFSLGGYPQKVLIEGKTPDLPVLIFLHGGPGTPIPFCAGGRGMFPEFTEQFILVCWDQLGCGINNREIDDSFSIQSFVQMTADLIRALAERFPNNKKYIFATSWGSILCAKLLEQHPRIVDGAVVCGQILRDVFFSPEVLDTLSQAKLPTKKLARLQQISPENYTPEDLQLFSSCLQKYTNAYFHKQGRKAPLGKILLGLLTGPDYRLADVKAIMVNGYRGNGSLWREILKLDLTGTVSRVQIPYRICQGDSDIVASTQQVQKLVKAAGNPNLRCKVAANTGHMPGVDMLETVYAQLLELKGES